MYNTYNSAQYCISDYGKSKDKNDQSKEKDAKSVSQEEEPVDLEAQKPVKKSKETPDGTESKKSETQIDTKATPAAQTTGPGSIFGPIDEIRRNIQRYRDKFVFDYDKSLADQ